MIWLARTQLMLRLLLLVGICYAAADLTAARIERRLQPTPAPQTPGPAGNTTAVNPAPPGLSNVGDLQAVLNTTVPPTPSPTPASVGPGMPGQPGVPVPSPTPSGPPPKLTGTLAGGGHALAVLLAGAETHVAGIGESVNGYEVMEVEQYSCVLRDPNGTNVTLTMDLANINGGNSTAQAPPPSAPSPIVPVVVANATTANATKPGTISSAELKDMLNHTERYANQIQVKAIRKGEDVVGMQVNYTSADNPFSKLGVTNGDVITSLNGHPLKGPEDLSWAYGELRNAQALNFQVERNGATVPLSVQLTEP